MQMELIMILELVVPLMALKMLRVLNTIVIWQNKPSIEVFLFQLGALVINPQNPFIYELTIHRPTMSPLELGLKM